MSASTGREGGFLSGVGNDLAGVASGSEDKGLKTVNPDIVESKHKEADAPSKEVIAERGDIDYVTPHEPVNAAKQAMERERGSSFTSASGAHVLSPGKIDNRKFMS